MPNDGIIDSLESIKLAMYDMVHNIQEVPQTALTRSLEAIALRVIGEIGPEDKASGDRLAQLHTYLEEVDQDCYDNHTPLDDDLTIRAHSWYRW